MASGILFVPSQMAPTRNNHTEICHSPPCVAGIQGTPGKSPSLCSLRGCLRVWELQGEGTL